jgi:hypothetical protein
LLFGFNFLFVITIFYSPSGMVPRKAGAKLLLFLQPAKRFSVFLFIKTKNDVPMMVISLELCNFAPQITSYRPDK